MDNARQLGTLMAEALSITIGDRTTRVDRAANGLVLDGGSVLEIVYGPVRGEVVVREDGRQTTLFVAQTADATWVFHNGMTFVANVEAEGASRRRSSHGTGSLMAPMPATVIAVNVRPGDAVIAGDVLVLLEAMKMELPLRAPGDALVSAVHCSAGDLVQPNVPLVDLDSPDRDENARQPANERQRVSHVNGAGQGGPASERAGGTGPAFAKATAGPPRLSAEADGAKPPGKE